MLGKQKYATPKKLRSLGNQANSCNDIQLMCADDALYLDNCPYNVYNIKLSTHVLALASRVISVGLVGVLYLGQLCSTGRKHPAEVHPTFTRG